MCLIVNQNWFQRLFYTTLKVKVAKEDINVYKVLTQDAHSLISPCYSYRWYLGRLEESPMIIEKYKRYPRYYVNVGFHSFTIPIHGIFRNSAGTLYNAIIPKGSHYIIGENNCIVSDQLIIISKYKKWVTVLLLAVV